MCSALPVDEVGQLGRRQERPAFDHDEVETHPQRRKPSRALHGVGRGGGADHQARRREHAFAMGSLDRLEPAVLIDFELREGLDRLAVDLVAVHSRSHPVCGGRR